MENQRLIYQKSWANQKDEPTAVHENTPITTPAASAAYVEPVLAIMFKSQPTPTYGSLHKLQFLSFLRLKVTK